jgi:hypothetical protein
MTILITRQHGAKAGLDVSIAFWPNGTNIDLLGWFDTYPQRTSQSYICSVCVTKGHATTYKTLDQLWEYEVFEASLNWINSTLALHVRIDFYTVGEGGTSWVEFVSQDDIVRRGERALQTLSYNFHNTLQ